MNAKLAAALRAQAAALVAVADALETEAAAPAEPSRYADLHEHGAGTYRRALEDIDSGVLPAFTTGKRGGKRVRGKRLVRLEDWHAWLERDEHQVKPASSDVTPAPEADDIAEIVSINDSRRRKRTAGAR